LHRFHQNEALLQILECFVAPHRKVLLTAKSPGRTFQLTPNSTLADDKWNSFVAEANVAEILGKNAG
jgi:hypothetical protein